MAKAAHFINRRESGSGVKLVGVKRLNGNEYSSEAWAISVIDAQDLVGGWIYLHETKGEASRFGGLIKSVELVDTTADEKQRFKILFESKSEARNRPWRGADHGMAWWGGIVDATADHELD
jgi:hypothetical protein